MDRGSEGRFRGSKKLVAFLSLALLSPSQQPPFRAEIRVVQIPVTVTGPNGRNIEGLTAKDFVVLDNGVQRAIALDVFGADAAPISLVVAVQTSGLSAAALTKIRRTGSLIQPLVIGRRGEAAFITFDSSVQLRQDFTRQPERIQQAIKALGTETDEQARLFDAVIDSANLLKDRPGRKVLLLISESRDRGSVAKLDRALEVVEREGIEVFAAPYSVYATSFTVKPEQLPPPSGADYMAVFRELMRMGKTNDVQALTQATGGSVYPFARQRTAEKAVETLGAELHSQYILSFPQGEVARGMHRLDVTVPNRPGVELRARRAYRAD